MAEGRIKFFLSAARNRARKHVFPNHGAIRKYVFSCRWSTAVEKKFYTTLGHKQRMPQIAVCHPRLRIGLQFTCDLGNSLSLRPRIKIYYFCVCGEKTRLNTCFRAADQKKNFSEKSIRRQMTEWAYHGTLLLLWINKEHAVFPKHTFAFFWDSFSKLNFYQYNYRDNYIQILH